MTTTPQSAGSVLPSDGPTSLDHTQRISELEEELKRLRADIEQLRGAEADEPAALKVELRRKQASLFRANVDLTRVLADRDAALSEAERQKQYAELARLSEAASAERLGNAVRAAQAEAAEAKAELSLGMVLAKELRAEEREACAQLADLARSGCGNPDCQCAECCTARAIADVIRARGGE